MFVRTKSTPNSPRKSIQIVETYRKDGKVKQKILRYIGIAMNDNEVEKLKAIANDAIVELEKQRREESAQLNLFNTSEEEYSKLNRLKAGRKKKKSIEEILPPSQVSLDDIVEKDRIIEGIHEAAGSVYDDIYQNLLKTKKDKNLLKDIVLSRLSNPCSKHKTQKILLEQFDKPHHLDAIYRLMDKVHDNIDSVKLETFLKTASLMPQGIDLLLFDVTTLYFESETDDDLRKYGYSKDHRFNTTQVVLALATNRDGLPIGYELFEGNKAEVTTLIAAINSWKKIFSIDSVCFVGDRAMMSKGNVALLEEYGYKYIIAAKLKNMPKKLKEEILAEKNYKTVLYNNNLLWVGEFEYKDSRLIVSYKSSRAKRDQSSRQCILDKIQKKLNSDSNTKTFITNSGVKKYTISTSSVTVIDDEKIAACAAWDGLHGVITNIKDDSIAIEEILGRYARLWKIEESFRVNKHTLKMRPIFHWKPERIKAHVAICYMAFTTLRHLEYRVNLRQKVSTDDILYELINVQSSIYIHKKTRDLYKVPGKFSNKASKIYKALDLKRSLDASVYLP